MSKPFTLIIRTLFWIFAPMTVWCIIQWIRGNRLAWMPLIGCGLVTGYTYFLDHMFCRPKPAEEDDDE